MRIPKKKLQKIEDQRKNVVQDVKHVKCNINPYSLVSVHIDHVHLYTNSFSKIHTQVPSFSSHLQGDAEF